MTGHETLTVELAERSYEILIGSGLLQGAGRHVAAVLKHQPVLIVTDTNVAELHLAALEDGLDRAGIAHHAITLEPGEGTKDFAGLQKLVEAVLDTGPERASTLIALGGGMIGDITGLAAALVLRGLDFIQIPTTLLAQVDSSVGGKTGINTSHGKNLVGRFHQPRLVLADTGTLDTLQVRELLAGYAELVKYGLLGDAAFFEWLERNGAAIRDGDGAARRRAVLTCCRAKAEIVAADELEGGARALLNLGHTFGHALEAEMGFGPELLHGEAVAIGMVMAFDLSAQLGLCPLEDAGRVRHHLAMMGLPTGLNDLAGALGGRNWQVETLLGHMRHDKKVRDGRINFVLVHGIGQAFCTPDVAEEAVARLLEDAVAA